jgi:hypothetical protein
MSTIHDKTLDEKLDERRDQRLETLYELREEFKIVAESDVEYAKYAENALEVLREEGYDV